MKNKLQWGGRWDPSIPYSVDWCCPSCRWPLPMGLKSAQYIIGIDENCTVVKEKEDKIVEIVECPKDFTKFWFHNERDNLERLKTYLPEKFKDKDIRPENKEGGKMR